MWEGSRVSGVRVSEGGVGRPCRVLSKHTKTTVNNTRRRAQKHAVDVGGCASRGRVCARDRDGEEAPIHVSTTLVCCSVSACQLQTCAAQRQLACAHNRRPHIARHEPAKVSTVCQPCLFSVINLWAISWISCAEPYKGRKMNIKVKG